MLESIHETIGGKAPFRVHRKPAIVAGGEFAGIAAKLIT